MIMSAKRCRNSCRGFRTRGSNWTLERSVARKAERRKASDSASFFGGVTLKHETCRNRCRALITTYQGSAGLTSIRPQKSIAQLLGCPVQSRTNPGRWLVLPDLIDTVHDLDPLHRAPAGHEGARERCIREADREDIIHDALCARWG